MRRPSVKSWRRDVESNPHFLRTALSSGHAHDVDCYRCKRVGAVPVMFRALVGTEACLCPHCRAEVEEEERRGVRRGPDEMSYQRRLEVTGLVDQARILEALAIDDNSRDGFLGGEFAAGRQAARSVKRYLGSTSRAGLLILSGVSGVGKSTASAWAVWATCGRYYTRTQWAGFGIRGKDNADVERAVRVKGVVVLDNALGVSWDGTPEDSAYEIEALFQVVDQRHQAHRAVIVTTQADRQQIEDAYGDRGKALVRRAVEGQAPNGSPETGGFVECLMRAS
jgi:hypothetical protein